MGRRRKLTEFTPQQVPFALSEAEQRIKAKELADLFQEIDKARADAADAASSARKHVRALTKQARILAECVRTGNEMRDAQLELSSKSNGQHIVAEG